MVLYRLFRFPLTLANGLSAIGGYLLLPGPVEPEKLFATFLGVSLLAAGASALNQVMERDLDRLMLRTMLRPLPTGQLSPTAGATLGILATAAGLAILTAAGGAVPFLLGAASLGCYLGVYTPLKRRSTLSLLLGGLCGAASPHIGWCLAGGNPEDIAIMILAGITYLWQIPHFWLLQRRYGDDYRRAGIPLLADAATPLTIHTACLLWGCALFAATMLLPALGILGRGQGLVLAPFFLSLLVLSRMKAEKILFTSFSLFPGLLSLLFLIQR